VPGRFAQTGPVLGRLVRVGPVPWQFASAGLVLGDFARAVSLSAHDGRIGRVGAFAWTEAVLGHFPQPAPEHLNGPYEPNLCLRVFLGRPSFELPKQGFR
jgi:hypothetical protein